MLGVIRKSHQVSLLLPKQQFRVEFAKYRESRNYDVCVMPQQGPLHVGAYPELTQVKACTETYVNQLDPREQTVR